MKFLVLVFASLLFAPEAWADAAAISAGGNPRLMEKKHPTVQMESETVDIRVGKYLIDIDCKFNFKNTGPTTTVKVGFPDLPSNFNTPLSEGFVSFKSFINGDVVPTSIEKGELDGETVFWHTQNIEFPANSNLSLREIYRMPSGAAPIAEKHGRLFLYLLKTGNTWLGKIEKATIRVTFNDSVIPGSLKVIHQKDFDAEKEHPNKNVVLYKTSVAPVVQKHTLLFHYIDFDPCGDDDLVLSFQPMGARKSLAYYKGLLSVLVEYGKISDKEAQRITKGMEEDVKADSRVSTHKSRLDTSRRRAK